MFFTFSLRILTEAVKNLTLPTLQTFHITKAESLSNRWTKYVKRFNISCSAITVTDPKQKLPMLLTFMGKDMWNIYVSIVTNNNTSFDDVVATFNDPFVSTVSVTNLAYSAKWGNSPTRPYINFTFDWNTKAVNVIFIT